MVSEGSEKPAERRVMTRLPREDALFLERIASGRQGGRGKRGGVSELIAEMLRPAIAHLRRQYPPNAN